jgi:putative flippase GtrA
VKLLRQFLAVGAVATVTDVVLVYVLTLAVGMRPMWADAVAIVVATAVSFFGHRHLTFATTPAHRWYRNVGSYLLAACCAGLADVAVVGLVTGNGSEIGWLHLTWAKALGLMAAFGLRVLFFRRAMFDAVRGDQTQPVERPPAPGAVRLSLIVPAYGEEEGIGEALASIEAALGHLRGSGGLEVIVVDDGSTDATSAAARAGGADKVIRLEPNQGKGAAVRAGMLAASGRTLVFTDADLSYAPSQVVTIMEQVESGWDVVVGSRRHAETATLVAARRLREVGGRIINVFTSIVLLGQYRDTQCGLKGMRSDVAKVVFGRSHIDGFAFDVEVFHLVERYRFTLREQPVEVVNHTRSTVHVVRDALRLVRDLFRIRARSRSGGYEISVADLPPTLATAARSLA